MAKRKIRNIIADSVIELFPLDKIVLGDRVRSDLGDLDVLKKSLSEHGLINPITISRDGTLIAGERRYTAAKELGWKKIEARIVDDLTDDQLRTLELYENLARKDFTWFEVIENKLRIFELLYEGYANYYRTQKFNKNIRMPERDYVATRVAELLGVKHSNLLADIDLASTIRKYPKLAEFDTVGQAKREMDEMKKIVNAHAMIEKMPEEEREKMAALLASVQQGEMQDEELLDQQDAILGAGAPRTVIHRSEEETVKEKVQKVAKEVAGLSLPTAAYHVQPWHEIASKLPDCSVGLVEADPPYAIDYEVNAAKPNAQDLRTFKDWTGDEYEAQMPLLFAEAFRILMPDSWMLVWCDFARLDQTNAMGTAAGFSAQLPGVWVKPGGKCNTPSVSMVRNCEPFLLFRKGTARFRTPSFPACFVHNPQKGSIRVHATEKPLSLYEYMFEALGRHGQVLFVPFAGSGNSLLAGVKCGMPSLGTDTSETYHTHFLAAYTKLKEDR